MTTWITEALILRNVDFGESDRILHLLTPETGRITVIAKGARRSKKRFPGTLDFFNHLDVQIEQRRPTSMPRLDAARLRSTLQGLRDDPHRFALGCYLLELLDRLAPEGGARVDHARLFGFAIGALRLLDGRRPDPRMRILLEVRALDALGIGPQLEVCVRCGTDLTEGGGGEVFFHIAEGGPVCPACLPPGQSLLAVHRGTLRTLERSRSLQPDQLARLALGGSALQEAHALVSRFLRFHVGLDLRSAAFLDEQLTLSDPRGKLRRPSPPVAPSGGTR